MTRGNIFVRRQSGIYIADWDEGARRCAVGRAGIGVKTREGDGLTPVGQWKLRWVLYRADRLRAPRSALPVSAIAPDDGWCDAPNDPAYNCPVKLPYDASAESLWREDSLYDVVLVVGYNDDPVIPGKGSAIFLHVAKEDFAPTEGCVAFARDDLLEALTQISADSYLTVEP